GRRIRLSPGEGEFTQEERAPTQSAARAAGEAPAVSVAPARPAVAGAASRLKAPRSPAENDPLRGVLARSSASRTLGRGDPWRLRRRIFMNQGRDPCAPYRPQRSR